VVSSYTYAHSGCARLHDDGVTSVAFICLALLFLFEDAPLVHALIKTPSAFSVPWLHTHDKYRSATMIAPVKAALSFTVVGKWFGC
jgi:hypothetical protein